MEQVNFSLREKANVQAFKLGMRDGVPIGLGYFAVAFSLGIAAQGAGLSPLQGLVASLLTNASAGEYAGFTVIAAAAGYLQMALMILVANARYLLMSAALSQRLHPKTPFLHRLFLAFDVTDELFAIAIMRPGYLNPNYTYGAMVTTVPMWAAGTFFGCIAGNILPAGVVSALSVALFGMFLAVIIPPARKNPVVAGVVVLSFAASAAAAYIPALKNIDSGIKTIVLTVVISAAAALLFPVKEEAQA